MKDNPYRPKIIDYPLDAHYDIDFQIKTDTSDIAKAVLIKNSSTTHNNNMDQRCVVTPILDQVNDVLKLSGPKDGTYAPPGHYMLFILDKKNIPSAAKIVKSWLSSCKFTCTIIEKGVVFYGDLNVYFCLDLKTIYNPDIQDYLKLFAIELTTRIIL